MENVLVIVCLAIVHFYADVFIYLLFYSVQMYNLRRKNVYESESAQTWNLYCHALKQKH